MTIHALKKALFFTLTFSAPSVFAETIDLGSFGNPCTSETARMQIIEKLFISDRDEKPVVFDIDSKRNLLNSLDEVIKGKSAGIDLAEAEKVKRESVRNHCKVDVSRKLGSDKHPDFNRLYQETVKKAQQGRVSLALRAKINASYNAWKEHQQNELDAVHDADQKPEVVQAARVLKAKLMKTNTLKTEEMEELTTFLTRQSGVLHAKHVMGWEYTTEKDIMNGEEHVVAYRTLYQGNGCDGYSKLARVTEMPAFKLPMKYFDAEKVKQWTKDSYMPGLNSHDFASVPLNFAEFQASCPAKASGRTELGPAAKGVHLDH